MSNGRDNVPSLSMISFSTRCGIGDNGANASAAANGTSSEYGIASSNHIASPASKGCHPFDEPRRRNDSPLPSLPGCPPSPE